MVEHVLAGSKEERLGGIAFCTGDRWVPAVKWLFTPEDSAAFGPRCHRDDAIDGVKSLLWLALSLAASLAIAQL